ncbi:MAG TPA: metallophosphoesterase [Solimonas sp.]|nr:metallophosphoesterase [Solimonas sp.]
MRRFLNRFTLLFSAVVALLYCYLAARLTESLAARLLLALPFLLLWIVPLRYWGDRREQRGTLDEALHYAGYLAMGWLNFALLLSLLRDGLLVLARGLSMFGSVLLLQDHGATLVLGGSLAALACGALVALRGPRVKQVDILVDDLPPGLQDFRILQISDLHIGPTIGRRYVEDVVRRANARQPDLVALTGDIVDGPVGRLAEAAASLAQLQPQGRVYFVPGNHEVYAGLRQWTAHFRDLGMQVLMNEHALLEHRGARLLVGGVTDPSMVALHQSLAPDAARTAAPQAGPAFRLLLAHHPKLAVDAEAAGFDLQLSGHTHGGQFFPWTLAVRHIHAPHAAGLSRRGRLWVYVSVGTGSWGPPVRLGTRPEISLLRLRRP